MLDPKLLQEWIANGLECTQLNVDGDGHHFAALIVSPEFAGLNRVKRQQRVYQILRERLDSGELHALSMQTLTPEEWLDNRNRG